MIIIAINLMETILKLFYIEKVKIFNTKSKEGEKKVLV